MNQVSFAALHAATSLATPAIAQGGLPHRPTSPKIASSDMSRRSG
ncbi:hypothetical protein FHS52_001386 [Erythromicrobium ramosum]|jgi:hypothetical protein|uniref:Uncharacterized protein n=1 Tax=Erythrobacter ramosus TaxID=35811 RepID=A0ABR6HXN8_9SPHN|nr:hypothetical protein [Erythrobacter ramosus]MBB3775417.1 hypothetical protein [Erythrobacter ramosus]